MKTLRYIRPHEFPSSMRIPDTKCLAMMMVTTSGSVPLGVPFTFSWLQNPKICLSSSCLSTSADDLSELHDGSLFLLEYSLLIESTTNVRDVLNPEGAMTFFANESEVVFFRLSVIVVPIRDLGSEEI